MTWRAISVRPYSTATAAYVTATASLDSPNATIDAAYQAELDAISKKFGFNRTMVALALDTTSYCYQNFETLMVNTTWQGV